MLKLDATNHNSCNNFIKLEEQARVNTFIAYWHSPELDPSKGHEQLQRAQKLKPSRSCMPFKLEKQVLI